MTILQLAMPAELRSAWDARITQGPEGSGIFEVVGDIGFLRLHGPIVARGGWYERFGFTVSERVLEHIENAQDNAQVKGVFVSVNSPGGAVELTETVANALAELATIKPVVAHIEGLGASAAYWIAMGSSEIWASRTAMVGSIGVVSALVDTSGMAEQIGAKVIPLRSSPLKGGPLAGAPIPDEMVAAYQTTVDDLAKLFFAAVESRRGIKLDKDFGDPGRVFLGADAKKRGLIDHVGTVSEALGALREKMKMTQPTTENGASVDLTAQLGAKAAENEALKMQLEAVKAQLEAKDAKIAELAAVAARVEAIEADKRKAGIEAIAARKIPLPNREGWIKSQIDGKMSVEAIEAIMAGIPDVLNEEPQSKTLDLKDGDGSDIDAGVAKELAAILGEGQDFYVAPKGAN